MTETPIERAARAHYVHDCGTRDVQIEQAHKYWDDCRSRKWVDIKIASMSAALAEYEAAKAEAAEHERLTSCKHPRQTGSGTIGFDGSGSRTWFCPDCGDRGSSTWPAREPDAPQPQGGRMSEMTMVEVVARAMEQAALDNQHLMAPGIQARELTAVIARAAIAAMRVPTERMKTAGAQVMSRDQWQAMIDEALR